MRIIIILSVISLLFLESLSGQTYMTALGVRTGNSFGLTINQRILKRTTVEGILQNHFQTQTTYFHVLAKQHKPIVSRRLNVYAGAGVHMGVQNEGSGVAGLDGVLGLEFTALRLNISADFKPQWTYGQGLILNPGVSVRYVLLKDDVFRRWDKKRKRSKRKKSGTSIWDKIKI
ncbi:MAG: hypothetical protein AAFR87_13280 [Bacteroidota bacterium]